MEIGNRASSPRCAVVLAAGLLFAAATGAGAQEVLVQAPKRALTVQGRGEVRVVPDQATVRLGMTRQRPRAQEAQADVNKTVTAILTAIKQLGIPENAVQTSQLTLQPTYAQGTPGGTPKINGYQASNTVTVRIDRLDQTGPVVDAGLGAGANTVEGISFGLKDDSAARDRALQMAAKDAERKAGAIVKALGIRIIEVLEIQEGGRGPEPVQFFGRAAAMAAESAATPVAPGELTVSASVTIRYYITGTP